MPRGFPADETRCGGNSRQRGEQCRRSAVPFTDPPRCIIHGGNLEAARRKAEERMNLYAAGMIEPGDPPWLRRQKIAAWQRSNERWQSRKMRKAGILEDWQRQQAEIARQEKAATARRRAERDRERAEWKARQERAQEPAYDPQDTGPGRTYTYGPSIDWDL